MGSLLEISPATIGVIGTVVGVLIGFFLNVFQSWILKPNLKLYYTHKGSADAMLLPIMRPKTGVQHLNGWVYYFRLRVKNEGRVSAKSVEVYAASLEGDSTDRKFIPMNLSWSHGRSVEPSGHRLIYFPSISPKMEKHCDLGHINHPKFRHFKRASSLGIQPEETDFQFDLMVEPSSLSDVITKGKYRLHLIVAAVNAKPKQSVVEISLSGQWHEQESEMLEHGVTIKLI